MSAVAAINTTELRDVMFARLRDIREREGSLSSSEVRSVARLVQCSERTAWRRSKAAARRRGREAYVLSDEDRELYYQFHGNVSAVLRARQKARAKLPAAEREALPAVPSRPTLYRAFMTQLTPAERAYVAHGEAGWRSHRVHLSFEAPHRNAIWQADQKELSVLVMPPRGSEPVKAWVTVFIDVKTRAVMGWSINIEKSSADVLMALRKAVRLEPEHGPFCGAPDVVIWDNGGEFLADAVTQAALGLQILPRVAKPYMPHLKGVVERFNRTLEQSFVSTLPGYVHGAKTIKGDPYEGQGLLSYEHLVALFEEFIDDYNHNHAHRSLGGISPKQAWEDDPAMLRTYDDDELRWITLPGETRVIGSRGIEFRAAFFVAPEISTLVGEQVTVHFMPHDLRKVEVWHDGKFLCEAYPRDMLTAEQREQFFAQRSREKRAAGETRKRSNRKLRARYAPMDSAGTPQEITQITEAQARAEDALRIDADLSDAGSLDLLDQTGLNQPLADENDGEL